MTFPYCSNKNLLCTFKRAFIQTLDRDRGILGAEFELHDSKRRNDGHDPRHGARAARFAASIRGSLLDLSDGDLELLRYACEFHTDGLTEADVTVQTCWDADRLDLGRIGILPDPRRLCTPAAREPATIKWAVSQSRQRR